jgi:VWFA-related protein
MRYLRRSGMLIPLLLFAFSMRAPGQAPSQPAQPAAPSQQAPAPQQQSQQPPNYTIAVTVPVVNVDAVVTDNDGNYLGGLKKENFRILEDGQPQQISNFSTGDAPFTIVLLMEFNMRGFGYYNYTGIRWADQFLRELRPKDWIALESFSIRPNVEVDFTHDPREIEQALGTMRLPPAFTEANLFDAVADVVDRMQDVKGRKAVLVLASGADTFSRLTFDKIQSKLKETDVTIFCVGVAEQLALQQEMFGRSGTNSLSYIQAQQQLKTFAALTGGRYWSPRFDGEVPGIMADVANSLRNQYSLAYTPTNSTPDGKYRKIKVELLGDDGGPFTINNAKGKPVKLVVYARQGYTAPKSDVN